MLLSWKNNYAARSASGVPGRSAFSRRVLVRSKGIAPVAALNHWLTGDARGAWVRPAYRRRAIRRGRLLRWLLVLVAMLAAAGLIHRAALRANGVVVLARREMPSMPVYFYQQDPAWADDAMGASDKTLGKAGDGVTCLASLIEMQQLDVPVSGELDPGTLNDWLSANGAYDGAGSLNWSKVATLLGARLVERRPGWGLGGLLERLLQAGIYPVVRVRRPDTGTFHDVLVVGTVHGEFVIVDPLDPTGIPNSLGLYNNRIYDVKYMK